MNFKKNTNSQLKNIVTKNKHVEELIKYRLNSKLSPDEKILMNWKMCNKQHSECNTETQDETRKGKWPSSTHASLLEHSSERAHDVGIGSRYADPPLPMTP